ncbi:hypothetical protein JTB14_027877 [Gonioctena quinquepunctata]|nr:hypothetical protein JTB14_027877 [Gonioctena quinquepunctata]
MDHYKHDSKVIQQTVKQLIFIQKFKKMGTNFENLENPESQQDALNTCFVESIHDIVSSIGPPEEDFKETDGVSRANLNKFSEISLNKLEHIVKSSEKIIS